MSIWKAYLATVISFLVIDGIWIALVVRKIYDDTVGDLMRQSPAMGAAGLFYLLYAAGIVYFAVRPGVAADSARLALVNGALLGAIAYGTYTVTNYAILKGWTVGLLVSDILWGAFLTAVAAVCGYFAGRV